MATERGAKLAPSSPQAVGARWRMRRSPFASMHGRRRGYAPGSCGRSRARPALPVHRRAGPGVSLGNAAPRSIRKHGISRHAARCRRPAPTAAVVVLFLPALSRIRQRAMGCVRFPLHHAPSTTPLRGAGPLPETSSGRNLTRPLRILPGTGRGTIRSMVEGHGRVFPRSRRGVKRGCPSTTACGGGPPPPVGEDWARPLQFTRGVVEGENSAAPRRRYSAMFIT